MRQMCGREAGKEKGRFKQTPLPMPPHTHTHTHPLPLPCLSGAKRWDILISGLLKAALCVICEADQSYQLTFQYSVSAA